MAKKNIAALSEQFRMEAELDMNAAVAQGLDPREEYLAAIAELTRTAEPPTRVESGSAPAFGFEMVPQASSEDETTEFSSLTGV